MSKVFFSVTMSLDGFIAPDGMDMDHVRDPHYKNWLVRWMALQQWISAQKFFREMLKLGEGGETGEENRIVEKTFERTGVSIMGKRMFDGGEALWPEEAPFHTPVIVLTNQVRSPWERPGGTTFYFVNDGIESALARASEMAKGRDIRIAGGANTIGQYLRAGLVDEFSIVLSPVFLGDGIRLFDHVDVGKSSLKVVDAMPTERIAHLSFAVQRR
jgi:dihydrofolate reductase